MKKYIIKGKHTTWRCFDTTKASAKKQVASIISKDQTVLLAEKLPDVVTKDLIKRYPIVIHAVGYNISWSDDIMRRIVSEGRGISLDLTSRGYYLVGDFEDVKKACKNIVKRIFTIKEDMQAENFLGTKLNWFCPPTLVQKKNNLLVSF